ncbi:1-acyl-sn-glycerol-3-phosphate acyltransferase, partial [Candidatus Gastranaerophilus sp. (ex Termes propinquus)]
NWVLGLFPQGRREVTGNMENINRGFAAIAKSLKCDIVPVGIVGALKKDRGFGGKITFRIGKPIPYQENTDEMIKLWSENIAKLTHEE